MWPTDDGTSYCLLHNPAYCVGSDGSVWSRTKKGYDRTYCQWKRKKLRVRESVKGRPDIYYTIRIPNASGGKLVNHYVHRLVLISFGGKAPKGKRYCCHRDGNPFNNDINNLYWGDWYDNYLDRVRQGSVTPNPPLSDYAALAASAEGTYALAKRYGIGWRTMKAIQEHTHILWKLVDESAYIPGKRVCDY